MFLHEKDGNQNGQLYVPSGLELLLVTPGGISAHQQMHVHVQPRKTLPPVTGSGMSDYAITAAANNQCMVRIWGLQARHTRMLVGAQSATELAQSLRHETRDLMYAVEWQAADWERLRHQDFAATVSFSRRLEEPAGCAAAACVLQSWLAQTDGPAVQLQMPAEPAAGLPRPCSGVCGVRHPAASHEMGAGIAGMLRCVAQELSAARQQLMSVHESDRAASVLRLAAVEATDADIFAQRTAAGMVLNPRLLQLTDHSGLTTSEFKMLSKRPGSLEALVPLPATFEKAAAGHQLIAVKAVGLNFRRASPRPVCHPSSSHSCLQWPDLDHFPPCLGLHVCAGMF